MSWRESAVEVQMDCRYGGYLHNGGHESTRQCGTVLPREIATKTAISAISSRVCLRMAQFGQRASRLWPNAGVGPAFYVGLPSSRVVVPWAVPSGWAARRALVCPLATLTSLLGATKPAVCPVRSTRPGALKASAAG